jgi:hypothetical protein
LVKSSAETNAEQNYILVLVKHFGLVNKQKNLVKQGCGIGSGISDSNTQEKRQNVLFFTGYIHKAL